ncbi:hypothetical protein BDW59DRAFT_122798 [Aspergillus cavernicola]|uniref:GPI anchored protein n=1 Tax=Aspergillus cavernicola TaxID=176166 RepID=A0ABR4HUZ1_9EURO
MRLYSYLFVFAAMPVSLADQVGYFDSNSCADPSGFVSCYEDTDEWYADCINNNCEGLNSDCYDACECVRQGAYTRCAAGSCWNMVYSCEYQVQGSDNINSCRNPDLDQVPFWPAPDNADGRCSCSVGKVTTAQVLTNEVIAQCGDSADPFSQSPEEIESYGMACLCCGLSGLLSSLDAFCPRLDPAELEMDGLEQFLIDSLPSVEWAQCDQYMTGYDCAADFGYPSNIQTYYGPGEIPEGGTETLRNIGALTSPVSATVTFTGGGYTSAVTATSTDGAVPTGSDDSDDSSESSESSDTDSDNTQTDSDNEQTTGAGDTPGDMAVHQMAISPILLASVAAILGVVYIL